MPLFEKCLDCVMDNLRLLFDMYGLSFGEIIVGKSKRQNWWQPFSGAVYHPVQIESKQVSISRLESYECINGEWTCYKPGGFNSAAAAFIGYVVKRTEARLRIASGYKYKLSPDVNTLLQTIQNNYYATQSLVLLIRDENFDNIIDLATSSSYKNIGADDSKAVVRELASTLLAYGDFNRSIDKLIPSLIKDYYLCNNFDCSFVELAQKYHIEQYYPDIFLSTEYSGNRYALYNRISNYRIERSRFYTEITAPVIHACFNFV